MSIIKRLLRGRVCTCREPEIIEPQGGGRCMLCRLPYTQHQAQLAADRYRKLRDHTDKAVYIVRRERGEGSVYELVSHKHPEAIRYVPDEEGAK